MGAGEFSRRRQDLPPSRKWFGFRLSSPQVVRATNLRAAIPVNSSRNSKCRIAVKSAGFDFVAPGSAATSTSTDELRGAPSAKRQGVAPQPQRRDPKRVPQRRFREATQTAATSS